MRIERIDGFPLTSERIDMDALRARAAGADDWGE